MGNTISVFRFLDLPAELRVEVYHFALAHNRQTKSKATPALLRTCRQIYNEANYILYVESTLSVGISNFNTSAGKGDTRIALWGDVRLREHDFLLGSSTITRSLPPRIAEISSIHLDFEYWPYPHHPVQLLDGRTSAVYKFLKALVASLDRSALQQRSITFVLGIQGPTRLQLLDIPRMFEPLGRLSPTTAIEVDSRPDNFLWLTTYVKWLGGMAARLGAAVEHAMRQQDQEVRSILEREVKPRLACR